jgi:hypothetical protein
VAKIQEEWLFMDSYVSLTELFLDLYSGKQTVPALLVNNTKGMTKVLGPKIFKLERKWGITCVVNGETNADCWKDKESVSPHQYVQSRGMLMKRFLLI